MHLLISLFLIVAPAITWADFFEKVTSSGLTYSAKLQELDGKRVCLRGYAILNPPIEHGILLSRMPYDDPHDVDETDVPFDAVAVLWKKGIAIPPIPSRPTVEGILHLGNYDAGPVIVPLRLDDAVPVYPETPVRP
jgi:hypothetical protein